MEQHIRQAIHDIEEGKQVSYITALERIAIEDGLREGKEQGLQQGVQQAVMLQLRHRFGELSGALQAKLRKLSREQLQALLIAMLDFDNKTELLAWLKQHPPAPASSSRPRHTKQTKRGSK